MTKRLLQSIKIQWNYQMENNSVVHRDLEHI
jgi:hypothetical protein